MFIRRRAATDGAALEAMASETHRVDGYPKYLPGDLRGFIVNPDALAATGLPADGIAVVARLLVSPGARRRGAGRALLEQATTEAGRLGRRAVLDVVEEHTAAIALYERCGWTLVGRVEWTLPGDLPLREFVYVAPG